MHPLTSLLLSTGLALCALAPAAAAAGKASTSWLNQPAAAQFAAVRNPSPGAPRVHGGYTRGCLAGARPLDADSPAFQILKPGRNRSWGHPTTVRFVEDLAVKLVNEGHPGLLVGDIAQARGGPLPSGHNSHQTGLDADIWLTPQPDRRLSAAERDALVPPSMVDLDAVAVTPSFGRAQYAMLARAAEHPDVERIFVSPPIKQALCDRTPDGERAWLRKVRPWRGHTAHMHVRLACPVDSDNCQDQDPVPEGDGCGAELASWMKDPGWRTEGKRPYVPGKPLTLKAMPEACRQLVK